MENRTPATNNVDRDILPPAPRRRGGGINFVLRPPVIRLPPPRILIQAPAPPVMMIRLPLLPPAPAPPALPVPIRPQVQNQNQGGVFPQVVQWLHNPQNQEASPAGPPSPLNRIDAVPAGPTPGPSSGNAAPSSPTVSLSSTDSSSYSTAERNRNRKNPKPMKTNLQEKNKKKEGSKTAALPHPRPTTGGCMKSHPYRPGTVALREIRRYQNSTELLIPKAPFRRLVRNLTQEIGGGSDYFHWTPLALEALQTAAEAYLVDFLEKANLSAIHAKRVTLQVADLLLTEAIGGKGARRGL